jgi:hypothetical protein
MIDTSFRSFLAKQFSAIQKVWFFPVNTLVDFHAKLADVAAIRFF